MSKNDLISLSFVYSKPIHVYAIKRVVEEMDLELWATISDVSIYNSLSRLEKAGFVECVISRSGNMPERKEYLITKEGVKKLRAELEKSILSIDAGENLFYIGIIFAFALSISEVIDLCERRIKALDEALAISDEKKKRIEMLNISVASIAIDGLKKRFLLEKEITKKYIEFFKREPDFYKKFSLVFSEISKR